MLFFITLLLLFSTFLYTPTTFAQEDQQAWIITDIHYLSPKLHDKTGAAYQHIKNTSAGKDFDYSAERMEALIYEIEQQQPQSLIISGDLTLNGEYQSMVDLAQYFKQIEALGTQVYVIPGNHDISSGWARSFEGDDFIHAQQVLPQDFSELFYDFGYDDAIERDNDSLSYVAALNESQWLLMLDSNVYSNDYGVGAPTTYGRLKPETLTWLSSILTQAKEQNIQLLPIIHHNSVTHFKRLEKNYTLDNAQQLRQLLVQSGSHFTLSGHIHTQHITTLTENDTHFTDIVTGAFSSYPSYIGKLTLNDNTISYNAEPLNVADWAQHIKTTDTNLLNYSDYMAEVFNDSSRKMAFREMIEGGWYQDGEQIYEDVADYVALANLAFFSGLPLSSFDVLDTMDTNTIRELIQTNSSSFFKEYISLIEESQNNYTQLIEISW